MQSVTSTAANGRKTLEMRVTASAGPNHAHAEAIAEIARKRGIETTLIVQKQPTIPALNAGGGAAPLAIPGPCRPLHIGASVAHHAGRGAGSLGAFVRLRDGGAGILSCSHVLGRRLRGRANPGDAVQQPGPPAPATPANAVAVLTEHFAPLIADQRDNLDAAVARISQPHDHAGNCVPDLSCMPQRLRQQPLGRPVAEADLTTGMRVAKIGRSTGFTDGAMISAIETDNVLVKFGPGGSTYLFNGVHEILWGADKPLFTAPGDSGAMVVTEEGLRPVGLHFCAATNADGKRVSYVVPWTRIRAILNVEWHD
ncbi:MAG: hypothetical protein WDN49_03455 [Acetobacteraceae bacterium]